MRRLSQEAGSAQLQQQRKALQEENRRLQQQLLDAQAATLQQQAAVADLQHLLAMAERRVDTPAKPQVRLSPPRLLGTKLHVMHAERPRSCKIGPVRPWRPSVWLSCGSEMMRQHCVLMRRVG